MVLDVTPLLTPLFGVLTALLALSVAAVAMAALAPRARRRSRAATPRVRLVRDDDVRRSRAA